jgi:dipeptidyl aminopeptidase/acylaminoacyl peptidase
MSNHRLIILFVIGSITFLFSCGEEININTLDSPPFEQTALVAIQYGSENAINFYEKNFGNNQSNDGKRILNVAGQILTSVGKEKEAINILNYALEKYQNDVNLLNSLALAYAKSGKFDRAEDIYYKALNKAQSDSTVTQGMQNGIRNRFTFMKNRNIYSSYDGAYNLDNHETLVYKFDPYLGTYPVFLNINTGQYKVLYPVSKKEFYYVDEERDTLGTVNFNANSSSITISPKGNNSIKGQKIDITKKTLAFQCGDHSIEGNLILPPGKGPFPAIVLIHGSGYSTRYNLYLEANFFAANGYAAFIYDKQGTGASTGNIPLEASYNSLSEDALAAVNKIKEENNIVRDKIGLWGHSEGGWIVPLAASKTKDVKFAILSSGAAVGTFKQTWQSMVYQMENDEINDSTIKKANDYMSSLLSALKENKNLNDIKSLLQTAQNSSWGNYALVPRSDWELRLWKNLVKHDPVPYLKNLSIPVLVLFGKKDPSVINEKNVPLMKRYLNVSKSEYSIVNIDGANHQFMLAGEKYSPEYFSAMSNWLKKINQKF